MGFGNDPVKLQFLNIIPQVINCQCIYLLMILSRLALWCAGSLEHTSYLTLVEKTALLQPQALSFNLSFTSQELKCHQS